ncbi:hypothetical protein [Aeromicrobium sp.]|uniref:hypothetical protein n=1 Tax=Aeromicrobium sp. TaxID=1871063 RepID=UPI0025C3CEC2|nr:hypothetical protein [Aeromicrobium sp.]MCK5890951.1 hypothetical protein [Aeromicrobium sp.]
MTEKNVTTLGDWLKKPISWAVIAVAVVAFALQQVFAPGLFGGSDESDADVAGTQMQVQRAPGVEVPEGAEVTALYTVENREREEVEISSAEITFLRVEGGGPECTGASRAGVQAKLENHLVGKRIDRQGEYDFDVIYEGRDTPVPDCVGATIQAEVEVRVVPYVYE